MTVKKLFTYLILSLSKTFIGISMWLEQNCVSHVYIFKFSCTVFHSVTQQIPFFNHTDLIYTVKNNLTFSYSFCFF